MKKQLLPYIIALMVISVVGILGVQWYWIKQSYALQKTLLDEKVESALFQTSQAIGKGEIQWFIRRNTHNFRIDPAISIQRASMRTDTIMHEIREISEGGNVELEEIFVFSDKNIGIDTFHSPENISQITVRQFRSDSLKVEFETRAEVVGDVMSEMIIEEIVEGQPVESRLERINTDSIIKAEMLQAGFEDEFKYAILNAADSSILTGEVHSAPEPLVAQYKVPILTNRGPTHKPELVVYIPEQFNLVLRSIKWQLLLSFLFSSVMIFTFILTLRYILRQKKIQDMKTDFINHMTHEFKTPLATIKVALDAMSHEGMRNNEESFRHLKTIIQKETDRLDEQAEYILRGSILSNKDELKLEDKVDLNKLIRETTNDLSLQINQKEAIVDLELDSNLATLRMDTRLVRFIIGNLIVNALKFNSGQPHIAIKTKEEKENVVLEIEDDGVGMDEQTREKVFQKYFRASVPEAGSSEGYGLGLSFVKYAVERHGGYIEIDSKPNEGSAFRLYFPMK